MAANTTTRTWVYMPLVPDGRHHRADQTTFGLDHPRSLCGVPLWRNAKPASYCRASGLSACAACAVAEADAGRSVQP